MEAVAKWQEDARLNDPDPLTNLALDATDVLLLVSLLALTLIANNFLQKRGVPVPEAISTIAIGVAFGGLARLFPDVNRGTFQKLEQESARQFMLVFIAPIVFAEGYGLKSRHFFRHIARILTHAFLGTLMSTFVVAAAMFYLPQCTGFAPAVALDFSECLAFGAMISSTDPVTTLAIFKEQRLVEGGLGHLYYSVLGESILNDAVAITLFSSFSNLVSEGQELTGGSACRVFALFCATFAGSVAIGVAGGAVTALVLKTARLGQGGGQKEHFSFNIPEVGVVLVLAYVPFLAAEAADLSGIVAIMFSGITMRRYAHYNLTEVTRTVLLPTVELFASLCETYVFVILGLGVFQLQSAYSASMIAWCIAACLVGRAIHVYPLSWVVNRCSAAQQLTLREQTVVWFAGLRGAIAFMCALGFPASPRGSHRDLFLCTTVVVVGLSILFLGWPTAAVLRCLDVRGRRSLAGAHGAQGVEAAVPEPRPSACTCSRLACLHSVVGLGEATRNLLMTSEAVIQREFNESAATSPRPSAALLSVAYPRPSLGVLTDSHAAQRAAAALRGHMPAGSWGLSAAPAAEAAEAAADGGRLSAPAALPSARAQPHAEEAANQEAGRPSAPARLLGFHADWPSDAMRSARMLCNP